MAKFQPGQSGNPNGRPKGALNRATRAAQALLDGEAEELTRRCIELAKEGNPLALKLCLERLIPVRRERYLSLPIPKVEGADDLPQTMREIIAAAAGGHITPGEAQALATLLQVYGKSLEAADLDRRITALEERMLED